MEIPLTKGDDHRYALEGYGSFRARGGFFKRAQADIATADGSDWRARRPSRWSNDVVIEDATGHEVGRCDKNGTLSLRDATYAVTRDGALRHGDTALAAFARRYLGGMESSYFATIHGDVEPLVLLVALWFYRQSNIDSARATV